MTVATAVTLAPPTRVPKLNLGALGLAALQDIGVYAAREVTVKAADQALVTRHINNMLDEWSADGANIWRQYRAELPWPGLSAQLTIDGDLVADITDMAERVGSYDRLMQRWETFDFDRIPVKSTTGSPSVFAVYPREDALGVSVWPVPPLNTIFYCTFVRQVSNLVNLTDTIDVPRQWQSTVIHGLAARLCAPFQVADQPSNVALRQTAQTLYAQMRAADRPPSYFMGAWSDGR